MRFQHIISCKVSEKCVSANFPRTFSALDFTVRGKIRKFAAMKDNDNELLPVVDEEGRVTGRATRGECHGGTMLLHPVVHLHLMDGKGRLYLQKRPLWKTIQPGRYDTAVGGHVDWGEGAAEAVVRETREELGLELTEAPRHLVTYNFTSPVERERVHIYYMVSDVPPRPSRELDGGRFFTREELDALCGSGRLTPNFEQEYRAYIRPLLATVYDL